MSHPGGLPLPDLSDPINAPHWEGLNHGRLLVQRCLECGRARWRPAEICPTCWTPGGEWIDFPARGQLYSATVYRRAMAPGFKDHVPYAVGLVELAEEIRMVGRLTSTEPPPVGTTMTGAFLHVSADFTLLAWRPVAE